MFVLVDDDSILPIYALYGNLFHVNDTLYFLYLDTPGTSCKELGTCWVINSKIPVSKSL